MTGTPTEREAESIWIRLRRRKAVQWGVAYVAGAWGLLQGMGFFADAFHWPDATKQVAAFVLLTGLPIVLVLAWYHGDRGEQRIRGAELAIIALLFLVGGGLLWRFDIAGETPPRESDTAGPAVPQAAKPTVEAVAPDQKSIAVLPFVDMSAERNQEYMSDGIADELLNLLAKVPELKVIARTSSFAFKGEKIEIAQIAKRLKVAHVLEGSVRKSGDKVRITAQLVRASDSTQLWSESYERSLDDIFAVQDEIAKQVVRALEVRLLGEPSPTSGQPVDVAAYNLLLQGRYFAQRKTREGYKTALKYFNQSLERNPAYGAAWAELAHVRLWQADDLYVPAAEGYEGAREAATRALTLDPNLATAHLAMAWVQAYDWDWSAAEKSFRAALALEPSNAQVLQRSGLLAAELGRTEEGLALLRKSIELDPLGLGAYQYLGYVLISTGRPVEAEAAYRKAQELSTDPYGWCTAIADALLMQDKPEAALREALKSNDEPYRNLTLAFVYHTLGWKSQSDAALTLLKDKYADLVPFFIAQAHAWRGENDLAFAWLERAYQQHDPFMGDFKLAWDFRLLKDDPRYSEYLKKLNFPE